MISVHVIFQRLLRCHWFCAHFTLVVKGAWKMVVLHVVQNIVFPRPNLSTYLTLELILSIALLVEGPFHIFQQNVSAISCKSGGRGSVPFFGQKFL